MAVDASNDGWGPILLQEHEGVRHSARYESGIWSRAERQYDSGKRECRAALKILKKFRSYVYGVHFVLEVDASALVAQLNRSAADLPRAMVTRWLAWLKLFDFTVKHVPGRRHRGPDGLRRRPQSERDSPERVSIDEEIESGMNAIRARLYSVDTAGRTDRVLDPSHSAHSERIAKYMTSLERPEQMKGMEWTGFKTEALKFIVDGDQLYRQGERGVPFRRVIDMPNEGHRMMSGMHDECGHKGRGSTYHLLKTRV